MVARIKTGKSVRRALSYNERKLQAGKAELLLASNFPIKDELLGFSAKMKRFQSLIDRNPKTKTNAVHISLNFPPDEKLTEDKLTAIAMEYMDQIGFAGQPFLVYRHMDAKHPHIHIVTTNLRRSGRPINLHNLAKRVSEPARKLLESKFGLIPAESRPRQHWRTDEIAPWPANYGKEETKHAITNLVGKVISSYKFADLAEFNAILGQFRVMAHQGSPQSRMYKANGLIYQLLDSGGNRVGTPIKASSIDVDQSPTLKNLEKRFAQGALKKVAVRQFVKKTVDRCLFRSGGGGGLKDLLEKDDIGLVIHRDINGTIDNALFVDHRRKAVFTAAELDIRLADLGHRLSSPSALDKIIQSSTEPKRQSEPPSVQQTVIPASTLSFLNALLSSETDAPDGPDDAALKKKKRRKGHSL